MDKYQLDYSKKKPEMFNVKSREQKAHRMVKLLNYHFGKSKTREFSVLDIGSSTGIIDNILSKNFKSVNGIDIDNKAIAYARRHFKRKNLSFFVGDALNLNFPKNKFDIVICTHIYEHVTNPNRLFSEINRVLKPGGVCYLAAVNRLWLLEPHYNLPFLSWLPKKIANFYVKLFREEMSYWENPTTYWGLKKLTNKFEVVDYTDKILMEPIKFGFNIPSFITPFAKILKYFVPTFFWILVKKG